MKYSTTLLVAAVLAGISWCLPSGAAAQGLPPTAARQFAELAEQNLLGERITVTSTGGIVLRGTVLDIDVDREILELRTETTDFRLPATGIRRIERRIRDPLSNGAWIGAACGLGFALLYGAGASGEGGATAAAIFTVPLGAAVGVGIDFAYHAPETLYSRGPITAHAPATARRALTLRYTW